MQKFGRSFLIFALFFLVIVCYMTLIHLVAKFIMWSVFAALTSVGVSTAWAGTIAYAVSLCAGVGFAIGLVDYTEKRVKELRRDRAEEAFRAANARPVN